MQLSYVFSYRNYTNIKVCSGKGRRIGSVASHHFGELTSKSCHTHQTNIYQELGGMRLVWSSKDGVLERLADTSDFITQQS